MQIRPGDFVAFISHKSTDKRFAMKLQRFIESYNLPAAIQKQTNSRKNLSPLCAYEVDFSSRPLLEEMEDKLKKSNFLILLCSEALVRNGTDYVNYELNTFIDCRREEGIDPFSRIIPVIISGSFGDPEHECCPEVLRELGDNCPIALDRKSYKNDRELFLHIICSILNIDFAVLQNRDRIRQRKKRIIAGILSGILLVTAVLLGEYYIPQKYHYLDFVMKDGIPEGICPLHATDYKRLSGHYVITWQKHKVQSLEFVNAFGKRIDHTDDIAHGSRPSAYRFAYTDAGLQSVTYEDKNGEPYFILQYSSSSLTSADFRDPSQSGDAYYPGMGVESNPSLLLADYNISAHSNISRYAYEYEDGYVTRILFHADGNGKLAHDNYIYGFEYTLDEKGRIVETYFLDAEQNRRLNSDGIYCRKFVYDEKDHLVEWLNLGADGNLIADSDGVMHQIMEYDDDHRLTGISFRDQAGNPVYVASYGAVSQKYTYNHNGNRILVQLLDENGNPVTGLEYTALSFSYDKNGFQTTRTYLDANGSPVMDTSVGYATLVHVNDANGNPLEASFLDASGALVNNAHGYARVLTEYNRMGSITKESYFTADGAPADYCGYGYAVRKLTYDDRNRETSVSYYDGDENPVSIVGPSYEYGYHKLETVYDFGSYTQLTLSYYDTAGNPVNTMTSTAGETYARAVLVIQNGEITFHTSYTADGKQYGERLETESRESARGGTIKTLRYLDSNDTLLREAITLYRTDGTEEKLTNIVYDTAGNVTEQHDTLYRENGILLERRSIYYQTDGSVEEETTITYDEMGNEAAAIMITPGSENGYSSEFTYSYNAQGRRTGQYMISRHEDGSIIYTSDRQYNPDGSVKSAELVSYEADRKTNGSYTEYENNYAVQRELFTFDESGNRIRSEVRQYAYDAEWNVTDYEYFFYDPAGWVSSTTKVLYNTDSTITQIITLYDEAGTVLYSSEMLFDSEGNPIE